MFEDITVVLDESQRQVTLMALAHLAVERPGWNYMLAEIAQKMDNDGCRLFNEFKALHTGAGEAAKAPPQ